MSEKDMDAVLVTKRVNCLYLSGFTGTSAYLIITHDKALLLTDFRYVEQAKAQAPEFEVQRYSGKIWDSVNGFVQNLGVNRLGFEDTGVTYAEYMEIDKTLEGVKLIPTGKMISDLRVIKDEVEISLISKAIQIADRAFEHILKFIRPGVREVELAAELEYYMKKAGAEGPSFETIVASGNRSSMPHGVASEKKIESGDAITFDYGALYKGYCSDITRTVFVGEPDRELKKIYEIVLKAQEEALKGALRGLSGKDIDLIARNIIAEAGYGDYFGHGLGHGVGLEIHEEPRFSPTGNTIMEDGMVVTVEPGIYIEGLGGVRIEDIIVINGSSPIDLTKAPKELICI